MKLFNFKKKPDNGNDHEHGHKPTTTTTTTLPPTYVVTSEIIPIDSPLQLIDFGGTCYNPHHHISEYGMVLNITGNPTIYDTKEVQGRHSHHPGVDFSWKSELEYLFSEGTTYYLKAYVLIDGHFYYGDEKIYNPKPKKDGVLFILKNNTYFNGQSQSYGLTNSSTMIANYLISQGARSKVVTVNDESEIDAEVDIFNPTVVIIEALWILSSKLNHLCDKYIDVQWIVRIHSNVGFLAVEYNALEQVRKYLRLNNTNLKLSSNNEEFNEELTKVCYSDFEYLPNIIDFDEDEESICKNKYKNNTGVINIGCFGALRILKNQLFQAVCAIDASDKLGKKLKYHVNKDSEHIDSPVLKNLIELFKINGKHELIIHNWMEHDEFVQLIEEMNVGLQLSFTESFNLVTADFVAAGVPVLVSDAISWMPNFSIVSTVDFGDVVKKIEHIYNSDNRLLVKLNKQHLIKFNNKSKKVWDEFIKV